MHGIGIIAMILAHEMCYVKYERTYHSQKTALQAQ